MTWLQRRAALVDRSVDQDWLLIGSSSSNFEANWLIDEAGISGRGRSSKLSYRNQSCCCCCVAAHQSCSSPPHLQSSLARMLTPFHGHLGLDAEMSWGPPTDFRNLARDGLSQSCFFGNLNVWYDVIRLTIWVNLKQCTIWPSTHLSSRLLMPQKCGCLVWEFLDYWRSTYFMSELQSYLAV